jgi:hypothetical protein
VPSTLRQAEGERCRVRDRIGVAPVAGAARTAIAADIRTPPHATKRPFHLVSELALAGPRGVRGVFLRKPAEMRRFTEFSVLCGRIAVRRDLERNVENRR